MPVGPLCYTVHADSYLRIEKPKKHVAYSRLFTTGLKIHIFSYPAWVFLETASSHELIQDPLLFFKGRAYGTGPVKVHQG